MFFRVASLALEQLYARPDSSEVHLPLNDMFKITQYYSTIEVYQSANRVDMSWDVVKNNADFWIWFLFV